MHIDWQLFGGLAALLLLALFVLYSAGGASFDTVSAQAVRLLLALIVLFAIAQIPPHHLAFWTPWFYGLGVILLLAVMLFGDIGKGAQRWLDLGFMRFQPSEMMKLAVPMMVAWYLSTKNMPPRPQHLLIALAIIFVPAVLILEQPDLGTAILVASAGLFVLFLTGLSWRLIGGFGLIMAIVAPIMWFFIMHDYQRQRVLTFLDPESDPLGTGYHIIQSKIAIGSGGAYGKGWLNGTQSQLDFLPERHTDFIFAVLAEEFGLIGVIVLLSIYLYIGSRGLQIAYQAQDSYTRLLAGALILTFMVYVVVNIGMVSGLLPVVGVPLPLVSYGGTSVVTLMASFGILMSIQTHRKLLQS
ncbi:MAG: rod shape-determining protein RodA [Gammaproteobacteria bacterium]|nr:rod shape-determining protein RodA [Gammaproteobacteria bacterium]